MICPACGGEFPNPVAGRCPLCGERIAPPAPGMPAPPGAPPPPSGPALGEGCPFEDRSLPFFEGLWMTIKGVIANPVEFYRRLPAGADLGRPILFAIILGTVGMFLGIVWQVLLPSGGFGMPGGNAPPEMLRLLSFMRGPMALLLVLVLGPIGTLIGLFLGAGIYHLFLLIFGGARRGFPATLRVVAYTAALAPLQVIPFCGGIIVGLWSLVLYILGLTQAHRTDAWRAVLAVLVPIILFACCCVFAAIWLAGMVAAALR